MEKLKLIIALLAMFVVNNYAQQNFNSYWFYITETSDFNLDLIQTGNSIKGDICSVMRNGDFIDCAMEDGEGTSIKGTVVGNVANVEFFSTYANAWGKAIITKISDNQIEWKITDNPVGNDFIPEEVILTNQGGEE